MIFSVALISDKYADLVSSFVAPAYLFLREISSLYADVNY